MGGSFHIAPGKSFSLNHIHIHDVHPYSSTTFNTSHTITHLSFGERIHFANTHPLDNTNVYAKEGKTPEMFFGIFSLHFLFLQNLKFIKLATFETLTSNACSDCHECAECTTTLKHNFSDIVYQFASAETISEIKEKILSFERTSRYDWLKWGNFIFVRMENRFPIKRLSFKLTILNNDNNFLYRRDDVPILH